MYGLENLILNESGHSAWYNFGYWTADEDRYEAACQRLALELSHAARLRAGQSVFDIGGGCGDQQRLWLSKHRLRRIHAINPSVAQVDFARDSFRRAGVQDAITIEVAELSPVSPSAVSTEYDCVLSLDAAYHIEKALLFRESARRTGDQGRLAFTDLAPGPGAKQALSRFILRLICAGSGIPYPGLRDVNDLRSSGEPWGWSCIQFRDITAEVFEGYARFMRRARARLFRAHGLKSLRFILAGLAIELILKRGLLRYVLVVFERRL